MNCSVLVISWLLAVTKYQLKKDGFIHNNDINIFINIFPLHAVLWVLYTVLVNDCSKGQLIQMFSFDASSVTFLDANIPRLFTETLLTLTTLWITIPGSCPFNFQEKNDWFSHCWLHPWWCQNSMLLRNELKTDWSVDNSWRIRTRPTCHCHGRTGTCLPTSESECRPFVLPYKPEIFSHLSHSL